MSIKSKRTPKKNKKLILIYVTTNSLNEAKKISEELLKKKLIACANIIPNMTSLFFWNKKINKENEIILLLKTTEDKFTTIENIITSFHTYEVPCILAFSIINGNKNFLDWIKKQIP